MKEIALKLKEFASLENGIQWYHFWDAYLIIILVFIWMIYNFFKKKDD